MEPASLPDEPGPAPTGAGASALAEKVVLGALFAWLLAAALLVEAEYYDGWDTLVNAGYFARLHDLFVVNRAPLIGALMTPALLLAGALDLPPLAVGPFHATMAALHALYLLGTLALVRRLHPGRPGPALFAFCAAVPTFLFFSYAPFLSHDLVPGALFLAMIWLASREELDRRAGVWLVVAGAAAALIKHTFALFWVALLVAEVTLVLLKRSSPQRLARLFGLACASGALTWLALVVVVGPQLDDVPRWLAPLAQAKFLLSGADSVTDPWWLYLRNAPAFGWVAVALAVPAAVLAWQSGQTRDRRLVLSLAAVVLILQLLRHREVRYLAFISPALAALLPHAVARIWKARPGRGALLGALLLSWAPFFPYSPLDEARRIGEPFYREPPTRALLRPVEEGLAQRVIFLPRLIGFFAPGRDPMPGDRYHRSFHVARHHVAHLYGVEVEKREELGARRPAWWIYSSTLPVALNNNRREFEGAFLHSLVNTVTGEGPVADAYGVLVPWRPPPRDLEEGR